jgi:hypothetical protein
VVLVASATDIISTTYNQPITTKYTGILFRYVRLLEASLPILYGAIWAGASKRW